MQAVGITSNLAIPNHRLSATSSRVGFEAYNGRLHGIRAWSPIDDTKLGDFLQVDLQYEFFICAVATQGYPLTSTSFWTTKYKFSFSVNGKDWLTYKENGKNKVCIVITTGLNPFLRGRIWRYIYQTDMIFISVSTKKSRYFMIRLHIPSNNAVIHAGRDARTGIKNLFRSEMCLGKLHFS